MSRLRVLSLFSGVGMIDLGLQWAGMEIVGQVEIEPYCRAVLEKHWPGLWRRNDVQAVTDEEVRALAPDVIAGGFPCQDVSVAGKGKGVEHGERSGLWREFARLIRAARPRWVIAENVPGLRTRGADLVLGDLEEAGYACWPLVVGAEHVGAPHKRHRVWIVANTDGRRGREREQGREPGRGAAVGRSSESVVNAHRGRVRDAGRSGLAGAERGCEADCEQRQWVRPHSGPTGDGGALANSHGARGAAGVSGPHEPGCQGLAEVTHDNRGGYRWPMPPGPQQHGWEAPRLTQSGVGDATDGASRRLAGFARRNSLKALGNGAVPQVVCEVGRVIVELDGRPA